MAIRYSNFVVSTIVSAIFIGGVILANNGWIFFLSVFGTIGLWILGALLIVLRFASFAPREGFWYILLGAMNFWLGLLSIVLYVRGSVTADMPKFMSISLIIGLFMLIDALFLSRKPWETQITADTAQKQN
jgi:hypothetical protein